LAIDTLPDQILSIQQCKVSDVSSAFSAVKSVRILAN